MDNFFNEGDGFGTISQEQLQGLLKALSAGDYNVAPSSLTGGAALQYESLDSTLKAVTYEEKNIKFWKMIPKAAAYNVLEEYDRQTSYGESNNGGFFDANAQVLPQEQTPSFSRQVAVVKYMGTVSIVTHPATLVRTNHGGMLAISTKSAVQRLLGQLERQLFEANGSFTSTTGTFTAAPGDIHALSAKFNGMDQQIRYGDADASAQYTGFEAYGGPNSVVRDLNGATPLEEDLETMAISVAENYGNPSDLLVDPKTHSNLNKLYFPKGRVPLPSGASESGRAGYVLASFLTGAGEIRISHDVFLRPKTSPFSAQTSAPATPSIGSTTTAADAASELATATYHYKVTALNNSGESAATGSSSQAVSSGNRVQVIISSGTTGALYYACYRAASSAGPWKFVGYVKDSNASVGGGGATFNDAGHRNPGCSMGYLFTMDADNLVFRQLAPMLKMDLAILSPAYRFMTLIYGTPIVYRPLYHALLDNISLT